MNRQPNKIEIVEEGDERFLVKTYADNSQERVRIHKQARKKERLSAKVAWYWDLKTGRRKSIERN